MIVLDANILIRAVLGKRVRRLLETYAAHRIRFYAPEVSYADAGNYLPALLTKRGDSDTDVPRALAYLQDLTDGTVAVVASEKSIGKRILRRSFICHASMAFY